MTESAPDRPSYDQPPLSEVVLGVQFARLPGFRHAHLGAFWGALGRGDWPSARDASPLPAVHESFGEPRGWPWGIELQLAEPKDIPARAQLRSSDNSGMVQVQNGRLHLNWLEQDGQPYPRYRSVRDKFVWLLEVFTKFARDEGLGDPRFDQWEVTYLNEIPKGAVWGSTEDWSFFRPLGVFRGVEGIARPESFGGRWSFVIPEDRGRVHVEWRHVKRQNRGGDEGEEVIRLEMTARGPVPEGGGGFDGALAGLDAGRDALVRLFPKLMSDKANEHWGLRDGDA